MEVTVIHFFHILLLRYVKTEWESSKIETAEFFFYPEFIQRMPN